MMVTMMIIICFSGNGKWMFWCQRKHCLLVLGAIGLPVNGQEIFDQEGRIEFEQMDPETFHISCFLFSCQLLSLSELSFRNAISQDIGSGTAGERIEMARTALGKQSFWSVLPLMNGPSHCTQWETSICAFEFILATEIGKQGGNLFSNPFHSSFTYNFWVSFLKD